MELERARGSLSQKSTSEHVFVGTRERISAVIYPLQGLLTRFYRNCASTESWRQKT